MNKKIILSLLVLLVFVVLGFIAFKGEEPAPAPIEAAVEESPVDEPVEAVDVPETTIVETTVTAIMVAPTVSNVMEGMPEDEAEAEPEAEATPQAAEETEAAADAPEMVEEAVEEVAPETVPEAAVEPMPADTTEAPAEEAPVIVFNTPGGKDYEALCSSCHGLDGKGYGAEFVDAKKPAPDLTMLAINSGGDFPFSRVRSVIDGRVEEGNFRPHFDGDMPVWGDVFTDEKGNAPGSDVHAETTAKRRIQELVEYLASIQVQK